MRMRKSACTIDMVSDTYAPAEEKKLEQSEYDSTVEDRLSGKIELTDFYSYMVFRDKRRLLLDKLIDYVNELLKTVGGDFVLDLGGADGWILRYNSHLSMKGVVVDISRKLLELGKHRNGGKSLDFVQADADFLPFRPKAFAFIIASGFLHHCAPRHEVMIRKIHRVLKEGGKLILIEGMAIGPEPNLSSIFFFYFPLHLTNVIRAAFLLLRSPQKFRFYVSKFRFRMSLRTKTKTKIILAGDHKAIKYPLFRSQLRKLLSKYFMIEQIHYWTWLSAFVLNILLPLKGKKTREVAIKKIISPLRILDESFCRNRFRESAHIYSITCKKIK